ncbi:putative tetratricopeptide-like helical domain superfamily [Dioscorea sansibarensis]
MGILGKRLLLTVPKLKLLLLPRNPNPRPLLSFFSSSVSSLETFPRSQTPSESHFNALVSNLQPGFTPADLGDVLSSTADPDLALDLFRWACIRPGFRPDAPLYHSLIRTLISSRRFSAAESLISEALSGACAPDPPLYNTIIHFCCSRRHLLSQAFDAFKKMRRSSKPSIETYSMLLGAIVKRFGKPPVSHIHLHSVKSLVRQMKASGIIPDTYALNLIIKAYSKCLEMDDAVRVFKEMALYNCEPNEYSYGYIAKGLCEKGRIREGLGFFKEMREKGFVPTSSVYVAMICSLAMERWFEEGMEVLFDMLRNGMRPDVLSYRTLLEEMCRDGKAEHAFELLEELGRREGAMEKKKICRHGNLDDGLGCRAARERCTLIGTAICIHCTNPIIGAAA